MRLTHHFARHTVRTTADIAKAAQAKRAYCQAQAITDRAWLTSIARQIRSAASGPAAPRFIAETI